MNVWLITCQTFSCCVNGDVDQSAPEESLPVQKEGALHQRSAMLSHNLLMCLSRLGELLEQYWPNLLWGQFNNTLQVLVL